MGPFVYWLITHGYEIATALFALLGFSMAIGALFWAAQVICKRLWRRAESPEIGIFCIAWIILIAASATCFYAAENLHALYWFK